MESYIGCGQRWEGPDGETLEVGMPHLPDGWWVRHGDGRVELVDDRVLPERLRSWMLVSSPSPGEWAERSGVRFLDGE